MIQCLRKYRSNKWNLNVYDTFKWPGQKWLQRKLAWLASIENENNSAQYSARMLS